MQRRRLVLALTVLLAMTLPGAGPAAAGGDRDGDGMPDSWEESHGLDPDDPSDAQEDADEDELVNRAEYQWRGDPNDADTDDDGLTDGTEVARWHSRVDVPDRLIGRVRVTGRCPGGADACRTKALFAIKVILSRRREEVATVRSNSTGRFTFGDLAPGRYRIRAQSVAATPMPPASRARVESDQTEPMRVQIVGSTENGRGLVGQATQSPTCAAQSEGEDCMVPLRDAPIRVKDDDGKIVARYTTGPDGYYALGLEPGAYVMIAGRVDDDDLPYPPRRRRFEVRRAHRGPVTIDAPYDSGIR
ncbi:MAG TPA: carboxypeptidase-like regulatory domain-containing protein [Actinomycetota bacterium]|jgi:hypothetical protein